jgi:hypothetical protein
MNIESNSNSNNSSKTSFESEIYNENDNESESESENTHREKRFDRHESNIMKIVFSERIQKCNPPNSTPREDFSN